MPTTHIKLTALSADALNARWHDQPLDLHSVKFDEGKRECVFSILERPESGAARTKAFLQRRPLQRCRVAVNNATDVQVCNAEGEVELYVEQVETSADRLSIKGINGVLELSGQDIEVSIEEETSGKSGEVEVSLATPIAEISWREKKRTQS